MYLAILAMILPQKEFSAEMDTTGTKLVFSLDLMIGYIFPKRSRWSQCKDPATLVPNFMFDTKLPKSWVPRPPFISVDQPYLSVSGVEEEAIFMSQNPIPKTVPAARDILQRKSADSTTLPGLGTIREHKPNWVTPIIKWGPWTGWHSTFCFR